MSRQRQVHEVESSRAVSLCAVLFLAGSLLAAADSTCAGAPQELAAPPQQQSTKRAPGAALDERVKVFTKGLELDAAQQSELRRILLEQSAAVRKIWADKSLLAAERAPATRAAGERAGDQIRAILNDEQRKKYNAAAPAAAADKGDQRSVEQWLEATRPH